MLSILPKTPSSPLHHLSKSATTELDRALSYVTYLEGVEYGWWTGGEIPAGAPAWASNEAAPDKAAVTSAFCAAIPNLMLRVVGGAIPCLHLAVPDRQCGQCCGGTGAYGKNFTSVATPFALERNYTRGTFSLSFSLSLPSLALRYVCAHFPMPNADATHACRVIKPY